MSAPAPAIVKIGAPSDIVAAVPHLLGFHPQESLVLVSLRGPRKRSSLVARVDLPPPEQHADLARHLAGSMRQDGARAVLLVCFTQEPDADGELARRGLFEAQREALLEVGIDVEVALLVRDGRWWSYDCTGECCPAEGTALPGVLQGAAARIAAESALRGQVLAADRAELERRVRGPVALQYAVLDRLTRAMADELLEGAPLGSAAGDGPTLALLRELVERRAAGGGYPSDAEAVLVVVGLHSRRARDEVTTWALDRHRLELEDVLAHVCRAAVDEVCAPVCTTLATVAYANGSGTLANVAIDRALAADPAYPMARLLLQSILDQVTPTRVRKTLRRVRADLRGRRR